MQFSFCMEKNKRVANHMIYEIGSARMKLEIIQSLSRRAIWLSKHDGLQTTLDTKVKPVKKPKRKWNEDSSDDDLKHPMLKPATLNINMSSDSDEQDIWITMLLSKRLRWG